MRASVPALTHATQQPPSAQLNVDSSVASRVSLAQTLLRFKGSYEARPLVGPLRPLALLKTSVSPVATRLSAESRKPAGTFSSSSTPPQAADSRHSDSVTSPSLSRAIPTLASVTALSAVVAPSAVAAVNSAEVSSLAAAAAGTAGDGALALNQLLLLGALSLADEPSNALSLPTWIIHVASVVEWVVAMALVWQYGAPEHRRAWRGLAWAMVPLLMGAMCACTWHFFYNSPQLEFLVVLQSFMTLAGNCTVCFAAFRIYQASSKPS
ncbi:hypothetical protein CLOM_g13700 [Closterium sp. NIES-68]|nr:hypothetical protein CLOM_g13700 [Closterium sp. NIES-68]